MSTEVYPVVHVRDNEQAIKQTDLALKLGANGVYLIDHGQLTKGTLIDSYNAVRDEFPDSFIGVNFLDTRNAYSAFKRLSDAFKNGKIDKYPNGLWVDDARFDKFDQFSYQDLAELRSSEPELQRISYLGGVAFKYTPTYTENVAQATKEARELKYNVDVVTTSGLGTGHAPSPEKIIAMKAEIGDQSLAVASGIDQHNIDSFEDSIDKVLVASSVETAPYSGVFVKKQLRDLIIALH